MSPVAVIPNIIEGEEITNPEKVFPVHCPTKPEDVLHHYSYFDVNKENIDKLVSNTQKGFKEWSKYSIGQRNKIFLKTIELLEERKQQFVDAQSEIGLPGWFAGFNVGGVIHQIEQVINQAPQAGVVPSAMTDLALTYKLPIGPVLSISPWNAPVILAGRSILYPLAAGCSVIVKPSEKSPKCSYLLVKCFLDAGVPANALQMANLRPEDNPAFIDDLLKTGGIKKLNFTGSTAVGKKIAVTAAKYLVPYLLELGGKNTSVILEDADLDKAAGNAVWSSWAHKGQICMSTDHVFVHESIYDEFKEKLIKTATEVAKDPDYLISQRDTLGTNKIVDLVEDALQKGGKLAFGEFSREKVEETNVITPIILEDVPKESSLYLTESFGPLCVLEKFSDVNDVVDEINSRDYGLKSSVWSKNVIKAIGIAKDIEAGGVHINGSTVHDEPGVPHGGVKSSGVGRFNSIWGIEEFCVLKSITINQ
ncbi:uncharacterized protein J8A68_002459 [[Candida] subhashii]|uniref:Aldehyde dehydrogenase domain-containing protein n=1 Tax=[Candida] subhashii TaxID=561895 RepID=A0A8J5UP40_9ASCO|nr:uncharacterized protein J8A68_002459 [[Candida] subhashii]KAG7664021.1 hypothetical protein J8A68_002459 [[Candida] subhashii]